MGGRLRRHHGTIALERNIAHQRRIGKVSVAGAEDLLRVLISSLRGKINGIILHAGIAGTVAAITESEPAAVSEKILNRRPG